MENKKEKCKFCGGQDRVIVIPSADGKRENGYACLECYLEKFGTKIEKTK